MSPLARILAVSSTIAAIAALACGSAGDEDTGGSTTSSSTSSASSSSTTSSSTTMVTPTSGEGESSGTTGPGGESSSGEGTSSESSSSEGTSGGGPVVEGWLRSFGAPDVQRAGGLGFAMSGELWVAGDVIGGLDLGTGVLAGQGSGIYLARYSHAGATLHAQALFPADGQPTLTSVTGLAVDGTGAVIVTGWLEGSYTIGGADLVADEIDVFVGKWDADGAPVWGQKFGEVDWQVGYAVAAGPDDSLWVAGAALAPFMAGDIALTGAASTGMFLLHLDPDGTPVYGRWWGEMGDQEARGVAVCADGSIALAGFITAPLMFGADQVEAVGDKDMFVAHLDDAGEPLWIRGLGGASTDYASHVQCRDDLLFAGAATGPATIGALELGAGGGADVVLGRFALDGALGWAAGITGPEDQSPGGIGLGMNGESFVLVTTTGTTTLGDVAVDGAGDRDVVLARYAADASSPAEAVMLGDAARETAGALVVHPSGTAALAISHAGEVTFEGLAPVAAAGPEDLGLLQWLPGAL